MEQYLDLLRQIKEKGTHKPSAREGLPGSLSLFGAQFRHDLSKGFPLLTTKKMFWKGVVVELLWFLRGDTNVKYLVDNGCNFWNEDAYNYYTKRNKENGLDVIDFERFIDGIKNSKGENLRVNDDYILGDCGYQYGRTWRSYGPYYPLYGNGSHKGIKALKDQILTLIYGLKNNPESRRHIVTSIDPVHDQDLALYWCHAIFQMNCRPIQYRNTDKILIDYDLRGSEVEGKVKELNLPKYYLDCHMYQRSADAFLGVPYNIASYALLIHILARICNMIPGDLIISYGDLHIYDNHKEQIDLQLSREPMELPTLKIRDFLTTLEDFTSISAFFYQEDFQLEGYRAHPPIEGKLSTGLK